MDYREAGVDITAADAAKARIKTLARATFNPGVLSEIGSFGGLFRPDLSRYREPVLVASTDGVGTKIKVALAAGVHDTVGYDLVAHCVDDILVQGAVPLFFLDYIALGRMDPAEGRADREWLRPRLHRVRLPPHRRRDRGDARAPTTRTTTTSRASSWGWWRRTRRCRGGWPRATCSSPCPPWGCTRTAIPSPARSSSTSWATASTPRCRSSERPWAKRSSPPIGAISPPSSHSSSATR